MNLYSIDFRHYSQKDSEAGIKGYVLAESKDQLVDWMISEDSQTINGEHVFIGWKDGIRDGDIKRERLLEMSGQLYDDEVVENISDLYYGETLIGWTLVKEDISDSDMCVFIALTNALVIK